MPGGRPRALEEWQPTVPPVGAATGDADCGCSFAQPGNGALRATGHPPRLERARDHSRAVPDPRARAAPANSGRAGTRAKATQARRWHRHQRRPGIPRAGTTAARGRSRRSVARLLLGQSPPTRPRAGVLRARGRADARRPRPARHPLRWWRQRQGARPGQGGRLRLCAVVQPGPVSPSRLGQDAADRLRRPARAQRWLGARQARDRGGTGHPRPRVEGLAVLLGRTIPRGARLLFARQPTEPEERRLPRATRRAAHAPARDRQCVQVLRRGDPGRERRGAQQGSPRTLLQTQGGLRVHDGHVARVARQRGGRARSVRSHPDRGPLALRGPPASGPVGPRSWRYHVGALGAPARHGDRAAQRRAPVSVWRRAHARRPTPGGGARAQARDRVGALVCGSLLAARAAV